MYKTSIKKQTGAILAISLIMLFMLSILGLAVMRTSTFEEKMAANSLHRDIAFQASETVSEEAIENNDNLRDAYNSDPPSVTVAFTNSSMHMIDAQSEVTFIREGLALGNSLKFRALYFTADSTSKLNNAHTKSRIIQGFYKVVPKIEEQ
jgi:Tfp pilus assembly protein PilX